MNKLIGFLALGGAAAAVIVGCSVETNPITLPDGDDGGTSVPTEGGGSSSGGRTDASRPEAGPGGGNAPACATTDIPADAYPAWKPPAKSTVCSEADVATFQASFTGVTTYAELFTKMQAALPAACYACAVTESTAAATWGPLVKEGQGALGNFGACFAAAPGGTDACGKAVQEIEWCLQIGCGECEESDEEACQTYQIEEGACKAKLDELGTACGQAYEGLADQCGTLADSLRWGCGPRTAPVDAGGQ